MINTSLAQLKTLRFAASAALCTICFAASCASDINVYDNSLNAQWQNWSWDTTINFAATAQSHSASNSISAQYTAAWAGLYLHANSAASTSQYDRVRFYIHGGSSGTRQINFTTYNSSNSAANNITVNAPSGTWTFFDVTTASLGNPSSIAGLVWQDRTGGTQPAFYVDDVTLIARATPPTALTVNVLANRHTISPYIYGMNFASETLASDARLPVRRRGGNAATRYNYLNDTSNHASDWYFENIPETNSNPGGLPNGSDADNFVDQDRRTSSKTIMTMPLIGWTPKSRAYAGGFAVSKYGSQTSVDPYRTDFGNGVQSGGALITGNDPTDTSVAIDPSFVTGWINHLKSVYGTASGGGVMFYNLDNETELWSSTHRDVRPQHLGYDELRNLTYKYGAAIKAADPTAKTLGPVSYGWTAYFYSDLDTAPGGSWWNNPQDRNAHGGVALNDWYLQQMHQYELTTGTRILDYFDLHHYPEAQDSGGNKVTLNTAGSAELKALRLRSTRSLWDSTYTDESWIGEPVNLIPRMKAWVQANYPGTLISLTEYNWGGLEDINGALTQAEILGIFGREGLDLATLWDPPSSTDPGAYAFRIYRNYDGSGSAFGETSIDATSNDSDNLSVFGAQRTSDSAVTLMIINKGGATISAPVTISGITPASAAQVYRYSGSNLNAITHLSDQAISSSSFTTSYPANSMTLVIVPRAVGTPVELSSVSFE